MENAKTVDECYVTFTQYLLPNGRRELVAEQVSTEAFALALKIVAAGYVFECEVLRNGIVSQTVTDKDGDDIAIELSANERPSIDAAREKLIRDAAKLLNLK